MTATIQKNGSQAMAPASDESRTVTFKPFGGDDLVKLSVHIVQNLIATRTAKGATCSEQQAMKFIMLCKARGLNPFEGDAFLVGYDGKDGPVFSLITAHQAFLKRAELHPEYDGMESGPIVRDSSGKITDREGDFIFDDDTILGAWATVHFKTRKYPMKKRVRLAPFNTGYSRWKVDPVGMIVKVAEADALRSSFPTKLGGMYLDGEIGGVDMLGTTIDVKSVSPGKALSEKILAHAESAPAEEPHDTDTDPEPPAKPAKPAGATITVDQQAAADEFEQELDEFAGDKGKLLGIGDRMAKARERLGPLYEPLKLKYMDALKAAK